MNERIQQAIELTKKVLGDARRGGARTSAVLSLAGRIAIY